MLSPDRLGGHRSGDLGDAAVAAFTIGRAPTNDIIEPGPLVSGEHCRIEARPGGYTVVDLDSFAGTFVNGQQVARAVLAEGDQLTVATSSYRMSAGRLWPETGHGAGTGLDVQELEFTLPDGTRLLGPLSVSLPPATLTAVIGPSGAGKTTLFRMLTGAQRPTAGRVRCAGHDLHQSPDYFRHRLGVVPQDDVLHRKLRVNASLGYAASLRFPPDLESAYLGQRVEASLAELQLAEHGLTVISKLSGGQRKRTSMAMELLTSPELLLLDEPTSGLDPGLDKSVMQTLRGICDHGRTVVVITHAVANLGLCDAVLILAPGGRPVFFGPPDQVAAYFGTADHAEIFDRITRQPREYADHHRRTAYAAGAASAPQPVGPQPGAPQPITHQPGAPQPAARPHVAAQQVANAPVEASRTLVRHQVRTLVRRQLDVIRADRTSMVINSLLPLVVGALSWAVPGGSGLAQPAGPSTEAMQMLVILVIGSVFMGMSWTVRDLVAERAIYRRERAVGLSPLAYLRTKALVFGALAAAQTAVMLVVVALNKPLPDRAVILHPAPLELWVALALTAGSGMAVGLLISSVVSSSEQVMPVLVLSVMAQMVLCGGLIPVAGRVGLSQLALLAPARWGFAAAATSVGLLDALGTPREDALWEPFATTWLFAVLVLGLGTAGVLALTRRRLART